MIVTVSRDNGVVVFVGRVPDEEVTLTRSINKPTLCVIRGLVLRDTVSELTDKQAAEN